MPMGVHVTALAGTPHLATTTTLALFVLFLFTSSSYALSDSDALLTFKESLANKSALSSWDPSKTPCDGDKSNWNGVLCYAGTIWGLQLEGLGLEGSMNFESFGSLNYLRTISLMNNKFEGQMPMVNHLKGLKSLYLSNNRLSGEIPDNTFEGMTNLRKLLLSNNAFSGKIPSSLTTLPKLLELRLNDNQFEGNIPDFPHKSLSLVSFANNELEGLIPESLNKLQTRSFAGNMDLCGTPLEPCTSSPLSDATSSKMYTYLYWIALVMIATAIILAIISLIMFTYQWREQQSLLDQTLLIRDRTNRLPGPYQPSDPHKIAEVSGGGHSRKHSDNGKLLFVRTDIEQFDIQDLLRASAEVLGSGTFGASYKAVTVKGQALVVKRYKQMNNTGRDEFHEHVRRLGRLSHPNLLPIIAYYYRREEKLLVTEFMDNSSLASHLHGNHSLEQGGLDWATRLKIVKGVARGLAYLYTELPTLTIPHGHIKSSNILLDEDMEPLLTDYTLRPLVNSDHAHNLMTAYKSPEYAKTGNITRKTDIWCLGILILEILTGKFPENFLKKKYDSKGSLSTWVSEMVKEKKTSEVFDKEMRGTKNSKSEMINLLKIGLSCCEDDEERRMEIHEVVDKIEELRDGDFASNPSLENLYTSRGGDNESTYSMNR